MYVVHFLNTATLTPSGRSQSRQVRMPLRASTHVHTHVELEPQEDEKEQKEQFILVNSDQGRFRRGWFMNLPLTTQTALRTTCRLANRKVRHS